MKNEERPEVRMLQEAIDKAIAKQLSEKHANPSYYANKKNAIKISVIVDAVPIFKEEKVKICSYLKSRWFNECREQIIGDYFDISKLAFQKKYKVTSKESFDYDDIY